jgi:DMSO reductase anchor subunit
MHPAFSVIVFTTLSGAGYGLWFWLGLASTGDRTSTVLGLALGFVLVSLGLLSSTLHLGKPLRAWRAFSQWRSSWLSREGVLSLLCYAPALWLGISLLRGYDNSIARILLVLASLATVVCTAMIYASLKPIPAWRHPLVLPVYLAFAGSSGGWLWLSLRSLHAVEPSPAALLATLFAATVLCLLKFAYWRHIDRTNLPIDRTSALGLPADREVRVFERPHTQANYLTREMGFVLARKHSRKLRSIAMVLFALVPALCALTLWVVAPGHALPWLAVAALSTLIGTLVERWLFFAEAKHLVTLYY